MDRGSPLSDQTEHRHSHDPIDGAISERQLLNPTFDELRMPALTVFRSPGRHIEHDPIRIDANGTCTSRGKCGRQYAVSTAEVEYAPAFNRPVRSRVHLCSRPR